MAINKDSRQHEVGSSPVIARKLFRLYERLAGLRISADLRQLEESQYWEPGSIQKDQEQKLSQHLSYASQNSPYWSELFKKQGYQSNVDPYEFLKKIPIIDKGGMRQSIPRMLVPGFKGKTIRVPSSGSTGEPVTMHVDVALYSLLKANLFRMWKWAGYEPGDPWVWVKTDKRDTPILKLKDWAFNCRYFSVFNLERERLVKMLKTLQGQHITMVRGYASGIYVMVKTMVEEGITDVHVDTVATTGENLFPKYREAIESFFGCKIYDTYAGDVFSIAAQCEHGSYHVSEESTYLELLDDDDQPVPPGISGHVVVSDFTNKYMPLFRCRIGDMATAKAGTCPCGRGLSLLKSVDGRDSDIIWLPNGRTIIVNYFSIVFENMKGVEQFQVVQEEVLRIVIHLRINDGYDKTRDETYLRDCLAESAGPEAKVEFEYHEEIPLTRSGKRRFVISKVLERTRQGENCADAPDS